MSLIYILYILYIYYTEYIKDFTLLEKPLGWITLQKTYNFRIKITLNSLKESILY